LSAAVHHPPDVSVRIQQPRQAAAIAGKQTNQESTGAFEEAAVPVMAGWQREERGSRDRGERAVAGFHQERRDWLDAVRDQNDQRRDGGVEVRFVGQRRF
jgi:hypothetical protein